MDKLSDDIMIYILNKIEIETKINIFHLMMENKIEQYFI